MQFHDRNSLSSQVRGLSDPAVSIQQRTRLLIGVACGCEERSLGLVRIFRKPWLKREANV